MRILAFVLVAACGRPPAAMAPDTAPPPVTTSTVVLVANKGDATVTIVEGVPDGKMLAALPTGVGPHEIAVSPDGRWAVVSDYGTAAVQGHTLTVVDVKALSVAKTIELGEYRRPHGIAFMPDGKRVVVTSEASSAVIVVDVEAGTVEGAVVTGQKLGHMLALAPDGKRAWVSNLVSGNVSPIDLVGMTAGEPAMAVAACEGIAVTTDGAEVWTSSREQNVTLVFDTNDMSRKAELPAPGLPFRLAPTPDGKTMVIANAEAGVLQLFDIATKQATTVDIKTSDGSSAGPVGTIVASDSKTAFVALGTEDRVAIVDLVSKTIVGRVAAGRGADGIGYSDVFVAR